MGGSLLSYDYAAVMNKLLERGGIGWEHHGCSGVGEGRLASGQFLMTLRAPGVVVSHREGGSWTCQFLTTRPVKHSNDFI